MNRQALRNAIGQCRSIIEDGLGPNEQCMSREKIKTGSECLRMILLILSGSRDWEDDPYYISPICPGCKSEEFGPDDKFCRACGTARPC